MAFATFLWWHFSHILIINLIKKYVQEENDIISIQERPEYSFINHQREDKTVTVVPKKVIIVDGILIFENKELRDLMDIKIFVDTDADIRFIRRLLRDVQERGRTLDSVVTQYCTTVKPMHEQFVEPSKKYADIIVPEGGYNTVALNMIIEKIRSII